MRRLLALLLLATSLSLLPLVSADAAPARLTLSGPKTAVVGKTVTLKGTASRLRAGTTVVLQKRVNGRWTIKATGRVSATRAFQFRVRPAVGTHRFRVASGSTVSPRLTLTVTRQQCHFSELAIRRTPVSSVYGDRHNFTGRLTGCRPIKSLRLQELVGGQWQDTGWRRWPDEDGRFRLRITPFGRWGGAFRVVKPTDERSAYAASERLDLAVRAKEVSLDGEPTVITFTDYQTSGWLRFDTEAPSIQMDVTSRGDLVQSRLVDSDGRVVRPSVDQDRYLLPHAGTYYLRLAAFGPSEASVTIVQTRSHPAELNGSTVFLPAARVPLTRYVGFSGSGGDLISVLSNSRCSHVMDGRSRRLTSMAGGNGTAPVWKLPADGAYMVALPPRCDGGAQWTDEVRVALNKALVHDIGLGETPQQFDLGRPGQPLAFRFQAPGRRHLRLNTSSMVRPPGSDVRDPSNRSVMGSWGPNEVHVDTTTTGNYTAIVVPHEHEENSQFRIQACAAAESDAELDGEPVTVEDSPTCPNGFVLVNFHADAGEFVGFSGDPVDSSFACEAWPGDRDGSTFVQECSDRTFYAQGGGNYSFAISRAGGGDNGPIRLWRGDQATIALNGQPTTVHIDDPGEAAQLRFELPARRTVTLKVIDTDLGTEASGYKVRVFSDFWSLVRQFDESTGYGRMASSNTRTFTAEVFADGSLTGDITLQLVGE